MTPLDDVIAFFPVLNILLNEKRLWVCLPKDAIAFTSGIIHSEFLLVNTFLQFIF